MKRCSINKSEGPSKQSRLTARVRRIKKERSAMRLIIKLLMLIGWVAGVVIAKGFGSTFAAVLILPYSWYLVIEKIMLINGWL